MGKCVETNGAEHLRIMVLGQPLRTRGLDFADAGRSLKQEVDQWTTDSQMIDPFFREEATLADFQRVYQRSGPLPGAFYVRVRTTAPRLTLWGPDGPIDACMDPESLPGSQALELVGLKGHVFEMLNQERLFRRFLLYGGLLCHPDEVGAVLAELRDGGMMPITQGAFVSFLQSIPDEVNPGLQDTLLLELGWLERARRVVRFCPGLDSDSHYYAGTDRPQHGCVIHRGAIRQAMFRERRRGDSLSRRPAGSDPAPTVNE